MQLTGFVPRSIKISHHVEKGVRNLSGKTVQILPETIRIVPEYGAFVEVIPMDLSNDEPESISVHLIKMDNRTKKALYRSF